MKESGLSCIGATGNFGDFLAEEWWGLSRALVGLSRRTCGACVRQRLGPWAAQGAWVTRVGQVRFSKPPKLSSTPPTRQVGPTPKEGALQDHLHVVACTAVELK